MHLAQAALVKQPRNAAGTMTQTMTLTSRPMTQHRRHPAAARVLGVPLDLIGWITRPLPLLGGAPDALDMTLRPHLAAAAVSAWRTPLPSSNCVPTSACLSPTTTSTPSCSGLVQIGLTC